MADLRFIPNSPTLINAGRENGQLSACFVLPVGDSLVSIFDTLKNAALIHQSGGGTGFSFSKIRAKGSLVRSTWGVASGPVSFMRLFDAATETIKQGGVRRGANMAILRVDHPDILEFVHCKQDLKSINNFNISVGITDRFMKAVRHDEDHALIEPSSGAVKGRIQAKELFAQIVKSAWQSGDPGVVFLDRINFFNPTPLKGELESTNPCGEQPLLAFESCNLGSLNLGKYLDSMDPGGRRESRSRGVSHLPGLDRFDWNLYRRDIWTAVRFLDNVIDINTYPVVESKKITLSNRKIGLGVMGFADLLLGLGIPYTSPSALEWGEAVMSFLDREAKRASADLARERGCFKNWQGCFWQKLGYEKLRNATVSTVAPTGTISMIAGASSGIEPIFSAVFVRNVLDGKKLVEVHPAVQKMIQQMTQQKTQNQTLDLEKISDEEMSKLLGPVWTPSHQVPVKTHVQVQARFQRHSDSAVSKTINLPESASVQDVADAYLYAYECGCKGITVYRDQSRSQQVLEPSFVSQGQQGQPSGDPECLVCTPT
jgi:ribonucleoside-diphosphate reductase alpha chain